MPAQLTYLKINKFRHVRPGSEIAFTPGFNVVVGQNGAGKTTLLELASALLRNNISQFARESFSVDYVISHDNMTFGGTLENAVSENRSETKFSGALTAGENTITAQSTEASTLLTFANSNYEVPSILPTKTDDTVYGPITAALLAIVEAKIALPGTPLSWPDVAEAVSIPFHGPTRIAEGAETFKFLFASRADQQPPGLGFLRTTTDSDTQILSFGLAQELFAAGHSNAGGEFVTLSSDYSALGHFTRLSQYTDARIVLLKTEVNTIHKTTSETYAKPFARFRTRSGNEIPHDHLSFGEKRLLAFLLKLYAYPSTIIVDELANGMHHSWLEHCIELLDELGTQAFLSSQNPLLLDCIPFTRETFATTHTLVICELTESGEMIWRNLSDAETEDFFRSLDVGLQHISEIMRAKGLW